MINFYWFCGMSEALDVEQILSLAREKEKKYDWLGAVEVYEKVLKSAPEIDCLKMGQIQEKTGYAFYRAAMQAESHEEFRERMRQAVADYDRAKEFYGKLNRQDRLSPWMLRCDAVTAYLGYWLNSNVSEKKRLLDECWKLTKETLKAFEQAKESLEYGRTYNQLSSSASNKYSLDWDFEDAGKTIREAVEHGEQAINLLSCAGDASELVKAYVKTAIYLSMLGYTFTPGMEEKERLYQRSRGYWKKANELSEETSFLEMVNVAAVGFVDWSFKEMEAQYEKALDCAKKTKDKYLIGNALDRSAIASFWESNGIEDPEKRAESYRKALRYAEEAKDNFSIISFVSPRGGSLWTGAPYNEYYWELALWETDQKKRRDLLEKAMMNEASIMELAESTRYPEIMHHAHHVLSKALGSLAQIETNSEEKRRLLTKALAHRNENVRLSERFHRFQYWDYGVMWNYFADLKAELSNLEKDTEKRQKMLEEAVSDKERCLQLCHKEMPYWEKVSGLSYFAVLGRYQHSYGELLNRLYGLTGNAEYQRKAIKAFEDVAESFEKLDMSSRVAECHWKIARGFEALGDYLKASESFNSAANNYARAATKIPQLKDFYKDHALYMQAWSEIERARHHHKRQEYGSAKEHFGKAADLHKSLKQRNYLAPNYAAWAQVEHAEEMSRKEQGEEAIRAFEQAAKLFNETRKSLQTKLSEMEDPDEKDMVANMLKATNPRLQYCTARMTLEEAKILDKKGDHYSSSEKYGSTAEAFEKIIQALESEQEQKEIKFIMNLSRAWQKMTLAEAEASSKLYREASQLFEDAKEFGPNEQAKMLALGHSRFCQALEAGTKFADTGDPNMHTAAVQYIESAAKYYVKAGLEKASEYAEATELLFDAYVHMDKAKRESDAEKKTRLYMMAEKILQTSADSFNRAEHPEKREQVLRLLEKVKKERELAVSLAELLHAPTLVSTTMALPTPTPTHEAAVGSEKFENADIQANIIARQRELKIGDNLHLEIELVNAGKGPALLIKVTELIPEGFEVAEKPEIYRVEDSFLNMKGKRLDPLKTEDVRLVLKPKTKGVFPLKPTILYLDENGKYKSHEPEPITITVKELGIKGWIKGER